MSTYVQTRSSGRAVSAFAAIAALLLLAALVSRASTAAFSDTTDNTGNQFSSGTIELTADSANGAMFTVDNMIPGGSESRCILVTYDGGATEVDSDVRVYAVDSSTQDDLAEYLTLTIEPLATTTATDSPADYDCTGITSAVDGSVASLTVDSFLGLNDYATGVAEAGFAHEDARFYRFTAELDNTPDAQGKAVNGIDIVWEAVSVS